MEAVRSQTPYTHFGTLTQCLVHPTVPTQCQSVWSLYGVWPLTTSMEIKNKYAYVITQVSYNIEHPSIINKIIKKYPFRMVDKNMELDLEAMLDNIKDMNIRDPWLLEQTIEDCRTCYAVSIA